MYFRNIFLYIVYSHETNEHTILFVFSFDYIPFTFVHKFVIIYWKLLEVWEDSLSTKPFLLSFPSMINSEGATLLTFFISWEQPLNISKWGNPDRKLLKDTICQHITLQAVKYWGHLSLWHPFIRDFRSVKCPALYRLSSSEYYFKIHKSLELSLQNFRFQSWIFSIRCCFLVFLRQKWQHCKKIFPMC